MTNSGSQPKRPTVLLSILGAAIALVFPLAVASATAFIKESQHALQPPTELLQSSPAHLATFQPMTDTSMLPVVNKDLHLPHTDINTFLQHLHNASVRRGWHSYTHHGYTTIILPAHHIPELDNLTAAPLNWATSPPAFPKPPPPDASPLIKANLSVHPNLFTPHFLWGIAAVVSTILASISFLSGVLAILFFITWRPPSTPAPTH